MSNWMWAFIALWLWFGSNELSHFEYDQGEKLPWLSKVGIVLFAVPITIVQSCIAWSQNLADRFR